MVILLLYVKPNMIEEVAELRQGWRTVAIDPTGTMYGHRSHDVLASYDLQAECRPIVNEDAAQHWTNFTLAQRQALAAKHLATGECGCGYYVLSDPPFERMLGGWRWEQQLVTHYYKQAGVSQTYWHCAVFVTYWGYAAKFDVPLSFVNDLADEEREKRWIRRVQFVRHEAIIVPNAMTVKLIADIQSIYTVPVMHLEEWQNGNRQTTQD